jgi:hypothetical protein
VSRVAAVGLPVASQRLESGYRLRALPLAVYSGCIAIFMLLPIAPGIG